MLFKKKKTLKLLIVGASIKMKTVTTALEDTGIMVILDGNVENPYLIDTEQDID